MKLVCKVCLFCSCNFRNVIYTYYDMAAVCWHLVAFEYCFSLFFAISRLLKDSVLHATVSFTCVYERYTNIC